MQIKTIAVDNFKAVRKSGVIKLKPLTVVIGNNGSGKSSLIEAVETYVRILSSGVGVAMEHWQGFEHIKHQSTKASITSVLPLAKQLNPMRFALDLKMADTSTKIAMSINTADNGNFLYVQQEQGRIGESDYVRNAVERDKSQSLGVISSQDLNTSIEAALKVVGREDALLPHLAPFDKLTNGLREMLFLRLNPDVIGQLQSVSRSNRRTRLASDGSNVAEYLIDLRERSPAGFEQITYALRYVLPYADDVEPKLLNAGVIRRSYIQLLEKKFEIPGWLMSSGSLRVLPLIATLLDPVPPPVVFIEEVENGLDPRTVGLVVDLMRAAASSGRSQVIVTTHSPYLLDMLDLDDVLLCERGENGPEFAWPSSRKEMKVWRESFMPGRLYTMNALQQVTAPQTTATPNTMDSEAPKGGWGEAS